MGLAPAHGFRLTLLALGAALALAPPAGATDFTVNDPGDTGDLTANDEICDSSATSGLQCTPRAAAQEANSDPNPAEDTDTIGFSGATVVGQTLAIGSAIDISQPVTINGCSGTPGAVAPCVGFRPSSASLNTDAFAVTANDVVIRGLAITNARQAIFWGAGQTGLQVQNCWFGLRVATAVGEANSRGIQVTGNNSVVGGPNASDRNVFANSQSVGVEVFTGDDNQILGNYFGTTENGTTAAQNRTNIDVGGNGTDNPDRTIIGNTISGAALASLPCDGGCNLIANATQDGIDLTIGNGPPGQTTIKGNHIGIGLAGTADAGNGNGGIQVGTAQPVVVGGGAGDRNYIGGNSTGISAFDAQAGNLTVVNNFFGIGVDGTTPIPDGSSGIEFTGNGPATITDNRFGGTGDAPQRGISLSGLGSIVTGNRFGEVTGPGGRAFGTAAIETGGGSGNIIGGANAADANVIGNADNGADPGTAAGIEMTNAAKNTIRRNFIGTNQAGDNLGNEGPGIRIGDDPSNNEVGNTVGGLGAADGNTISNNGGAAVEVIGPDGFSNLIVGNTGLANGGPFIDLTPPAGSGNNNPGGANQGVQPPTIATSTGTSASGTAAPGALVHLYRTNAAQGTAPTSVTEALGSDTADGGGNWSVNPHPALQPGQQVAATQTVNVNNPPAGGQGGQRNTSELSLAGLPLPPAPGTGTGGSTGTGGVVGGTGGGLITGPLQGLLGFGARTNVTLGLGGSSARSAAINVSNANSFVVNATLTGQTVGTFNSRAAQKRRRRKRRLSLGRKSFTVAARATRRVTLSLPRAARRQLGRRRRLALSFTATVRDPAGTTRTVRRKLTLRLKRPRSRRRR